MKYVDLHMHTIYSDGLCSPEQVILTSFLRGTEVMAITDHDTTEGYDKSKGFDKSLGVKLVSGVEITTEKYHILGYDFDHEEGNLQELLRYSRECQETNTLKRAEMIRTTGVPISIEKIKHYFPRSRLGKFNIAASLVMDEECRKYLKEKTHTEAFDLYLKEGGIAHKIEDKKSVKTEEAINAIHEAGGCAVIAHPFYDIEDPAELEKLVELKIDGVEINPFSKDSKKFLKQYAKNKGLIMTYGSDFHGAFFPEKPLLGRGENLIEKFWE